MTIAAGGRPVSCVANADLASTHARSLAAACAAWAHDFADAVHRSTMTALRRSTTNNCPGANMSNQDEVTTRDQDASKQAETACLDLSASEFHLVLTDVNAPADQRRWSLDLKDGTFTLRLWNDNMAHCRVLEVMRVGTSPTVITHAPRGT